MVIAADCRAWERRLLQRRDCKKNSRIHETSWRDDDRTRPRRIFQRMGRTDFHDLSRLDGLRIASERTRTCRAGNAEHHGEISTGPEKLGVRFHERSSHHDRSQEAGLFRFGEIHRGSETTKIACGYTAFKGMG